MNKEVHNKNFRELIRTLEKKIELLNKQDTCCSNISLGQCHTLVEIGRSKTISLKDLSNILGLDISTASRTVESLVKKNYVLRCPSKIDRRSIDIQLTDDGFEIFTDIENRMDRKFSAILSQIPQEDHSTVLNGLNIIIEALSEEKLAPNN